MKRDLVVYGAGGHGKVVAATALAAGWRVIGFADDAVAHANSEVLGLRVAPWREFESCGAAVVVGIGDNAARAAVLERLAALHLALPVIRHPSAVIDPHARVGDGTVVLPTAVLNVAARVGRGCIVNSGAVVEHDCDLDDFVHLSPNATLGGGVRIGARAHVGLGASVLPLLRIGADAVIGAGAVVVGDVRDGAVMAGVPARELRRHS